MTVKDLIIQLLNVPSLDSEVIIEIDKTKLSTNGYWYSQLAIKDVFGFNDCTIIAEELE